MVVKISFKEENLQVITKIVSRLVNSDKLVERSKGVLFNNIYREIQIFSTSPEKWWYGDMPAYRYFLGRESGGIAVDLFIIIESVLELKENKTKYYTPGRIRVALIKRPEKLSIKEALSPISKVKTISISLEILMINRKMLGEEDLEKIAQYKFCRIEENWLILCLLRKSIYEKDRTQIFIPFPVIAYHRSEKHKQQPIETYYVNCNDILGT